VTAGWGLSNSTSTAVPSPPAFTVAWAASCLLRIFASARKDAGGACQAIQFIPSARSFVESSADRGPA
jgi:hypothetical protein